MDNIKILFLSANSIQVAHLDIEEEYREIETKIRASEYRDRLELIPSFAARPDDWLQQLNRYHPHIVHFSGHGSKDGALYMIGEKGPVKVEPLILKDLFRTLKDNVRVVVLNACYSKQQAEAITDVIDCVIGMNKAIGDAAAINFAASFYRAIGFGKSIQNSFDQGKLSLRLAGIPEENTPELLVKSGVDAANIALLSTPLPGEQSSSGSSNNATPIFISYAPQDRKWCDELAKHLTPMRRQGLISIWYDENINAGAEAKRIAAEQLSAARIILLMISPDYIASDDIYEGELARAVSRHKAGTARVIPILVRDTDGWKDFEFGKLKALPKDEKSIQKLGNSDSTLATIASEIRRVVKELQSA